MKNLFILILALLMNVTVIQALGDSLYEISSPVDFLDQSSGQTRTYNRSNNYRYQILDKGSWFYRVKIFDQNGREIPGNFISSHANINNSFTHTVIEDFIQVTREVSNAGDPPVCDFCERGGEGSNGTISENCNIPGTDEDWQRKCEQLYNSNIPAAALDYTLKAMKMNSTSFRSNKCFNSQGLKASGHPSMNGMTADRLSSLLENGLPNKCQIVINNVDDRSPSAEPNGWNNCRGRMYYIDLCQGSDPVVKEDYFNIGTGTCRSGKNGYRNGEDLHTTVKGVFFTHNETFDFRDTTTQQTQYAAVQKQVEAAGGERQATAVHLFGLQNTNNMASRTGKYMHVSPHQSSWGCPSIKPENYYMIEALAENGPSMVVHWSKDGMEDLEQCSE